MLMLKSKRVSSIEHEAAAQRLAVLIDADNAQPGVIGALLAEIALLGEATVKRIYGDFTKSTSSQWKQMLNRFAINPIQQFAYTTGKNATDSRLIIDAMDLLHEGRVDGFCLVSSDSDFTGLASRIREEGLQVYGFGERKTPEAFRNACHLFVFTENLKPVSLAEESQGPEQPKKQGLKKTKAASKKSTDSLNAKDGKGIHVDFLKEAVENTSDEAGWAHLGQLGNYIRKIRPDFDPRSFGCKNLMELFSAFAATFELQDRAASGSQTKILYVRKKAAQ